MKSTLLIACALALPPSSFKSFTARDFLNEYRGFKQFVRQRVLEHWQERGVDLLLVPRQIHLVPDGYHRASFLWRGYQVYYRKERTDA